MGQQISDGYMDITLKWPIVTVMLANHHDMEGGLPPKKRKVSAISPVCMSALYTDTLKLSAKAVSATAHRLLPRKVARWR